MSDTKRCEWRLLIEGRRRDEPRQRGKISHDISSAAVLLQGARNWLVDSGGPGFDDELLAALDTGGLGPGDIHGLVCTHRHLDHVANNHLFSHAPVVMPWSVWSPRRERKVRIYGCFENMPSFDDFEIIPTPGHLASHLAVAARVPEGRLVIAGDAVRESILHSGGEALRYVDRERYLPSALRVLDGADVVVPGHGPVIRGKGLEELRELARQLL